MSGLRRVRKLPVEVEALHWTGDNYDEVRGWVGDAFIRVAIMNGGPTAIRIRTLEGPFIATLGDWIIKGVQGEFYPCKPDIFDQTYEIIE